MDRVCPLCGGKVSKKNKSKGAICGSCTSKYKHALGECEFKDLSPRAMVRGGRVFCCRCKELMVLKAGEELKPDVVPGTES